MPAGTPGFELAEDQPPCEADSQRLQAGEQSALDK